MTAAAAAPSRTPSARREEWFLTAAGAGGAAGAAWVAAQLGLLGVIAGVAALAGTAVLVVVRNRSLWLMFAAVGSLVLLLHKTIGPEDIDVQSGALGLSVSSLNVVVAACFAFWALEGTMRADLRWAARQPVFWAPLVALFLMSFSILVAREPFLSVAELLRMLGLYLLFLYFGARRHTRRDIVAVFAAFAGFVLVQFVVVILQWKTGGVLGLGFLGVPTQLTERTLDVGAIGRPFGTVVHPVFLGTVLAMSALMALSFAIHLRNTRARILSIAVVPFCVVPMALAHTRGPALAFAAAAAFLVALSVVRHRISTRALVMSGIVIVVLAAVVWPKISTLVAENFGTQHFDTEVESRFQLNEVAFRMIDDSPFVGHGLNNYTEVMDGYVREPLLFPGFPAHNLVLLQTAETGAVGLLGMAIIFFTLVHAAWKLARSRDAFFCAVGVGMLSIYLFTFVEELLSYSFRQEIPLAFFWIFAGLSVACLRMDGGSRTAPAQVPRVRGVPRVPRQPRVPSSRSRRPSRRSSRRPSARRPRATRTLAVFLALPIVGGWYATGGLGLPRGNPSDPASGLRIVFSAFERSDAADHAVYVVEPDAGAPRRITPDDGATYSWPQWAMNGTKIVYTRRAGRPGTPENVFLADADGSHPIQLTQAMWRVDQPKVSPDGRTLLFAAFWPQSPQVAIYTADLETLEVTNLSAVASTEPSFDSDPKWTSDGRIVFSQSLDDTGTTRPTAIWTMNVDGTGRQPLAQDRFFNVDGELSRDGRMLAYGSYRGEGRPAATENSIDPFQVKAAPWMLVTADRATGARRVLTAGRECADVSHPCGPQEASAAVPNWTPDGSTIGYLSLLSPTRVCVCAIGRDGSDPRVIVESETLAIDWFNWSMPGAPPRTAVPDDGIGARRSNARLLFGGPSSFGLPPLAESRNDRWEDIGIALPAGLAPTAARWSRDRSKVVFSARVPYDTTRFEPGPPPPAGEQRHVHFTLEQLSPLFVPPEAPLAGVAEEQVFLLDRMTGNVRQLTTPWTEDYMDAMRDGDARANRDPDISPDGRYVTATNVSALNGESFILRIDLLTGAVFNLTNATSGAVPVADGGARYSPDGQHIVFWTVWGETAQLALMETQGGRGFRFLTDDPSSNIAPSWSPDGRRVVFARYPAEAGRAGGAEGRDTAIVTLDVETGEQRVVATDLRGGASSPVWSPDGGRIGFISISDPGQSDIYVVPATGGPARPLQISYLTNELFLDWR